MSEKITLIDPHELTAHEKVSIPHALYILCKMIITGTFNVPLLIDSKTKTILDGHHRCYAANRLGLKKIPCYSVDYLLDLSVKVYSRRSNIQIDKSKVVDMALSPTVFPQKTTRHEYEKPMFKPIKIKKLKK